MTAALEGSEWSAARPGRTLPPGKTWYPFYRRLGGHQGRSGRAENLSPTGIRCPDHPGRSQSLYRLNYPAHSNYRGIEHLTTSYKILSNILLSRLTTYADEIIVDHKCGLRRSRSPTDHILCIRQILEEKNGNTTKQCISCCGKSRIHRDLIPGPP